MPYFEDFHEFVQRMGTNPVQTRGRFYFSNGATSDGNLDHRDPPADPTELVVNRHTYAKGRFEQLRTEYEQTRLQIATQIEWYKQGVGPMPEPGWEEHLRKLRSQMLAVAVISKKLAAQLPTEWREEMEAEKLDRRHRYAREAIHALQAIEE